MILILYSCFNVSCAAQQEYTASVSTERLHKKKILFQFLPTLLYIAFIASAVYYAYTRIVYGTAGLGALKYYSYAVLFVEMLGATSMLFYGCWLVARTDNSDIAEAMARSRDMGSKDKRSLSKYASLLKIGITYQDRHHIPYDQ
jgi:hypothetical protein